MTETRSLPADDAGLAEAARLLSEGQLLAFPTETVYGLGADARNGRAVAGIFEAKGRPRFNPLIVHVADLDAANQIGRFNTSAARLAESFWPGPLTLVVPLRAESGLSDLVTAGLDTVALRVPAHPLAQKLLQRFAGPIAAPSANPSGTVSPTTAAHVVDGLGGRIAAVLDGGACPLGLESTILGFGPEGPRLLRPGGLAVESIEAVLERSLACHDEAENGITAPGQLASHYAPQARLRLNAEAPEPGEAWLGFGRDPKGLDAPSMSLSVTGDLREAAANLFAHLRALDRLAGPGGTIAVAPVPEAGLGRAINDRLRRAAAPRS